LKSTLSSENASDASSPGARPGGAARALLFLVEAYRLTLSPLMGGHCRFVPSCSLYAEEALRRHGAVRGAGLAARRVLRCHPFHPGGADPVP